MSFDFGFCVFRYQAIWQAREGLSVDAGLRYAHAGGELIHEFRLGLTWSFSLGKEG